MQKRGLTKRQKVEEPDAISKLFEMRMNPKDNQAELIRQLETARMRCDHDDLLKEFENHMQDRSFLGFITVEERSRLFKWLTYHNYIGCYFIYFAHAQPGALAIGFTCHSSFIPNALILNGHPLSFSSHHNPDLRRWARTPLDRSEALIYRDKVRSLARPGVYMCILCLSKRMGVPKDVAQMIGRMLWEMRGAFI